MNKMENNSAYKEKILDLYEDRSNYGELKNNTHHTKLKNPICTDEISIDLIVKDGIVVDCKFKGITCFVSSFSSAAVMRMIKGKKVEDVLNLSKKDIDNFLGQEINPTRIKCQLLPLEAVKKCLK